MACLLLNNALEMVLRDSGVEKKGTIYYKSTQILTHADNLDIIGKSRKAAKEAFYQHK